MTNLAQQGRASIKAGSKSFALASKVLPPALRDDASMLYAWCRHCDDVVDGQEMGHGQIRDYRLGQGERLQALRDQTAAAFAGRSAPPEFIGMAQVFARHTIPPRHANEHLNGFQMDVDERVYRSVDDILDYSYHVAGVVGVMMAHIMGVRDDPTLDRASDLGLAFQLTNIARDVIDDAKAGRVFVPSELLEKHGAPIEPDRLASREHWPAAHLAAVDLLDIAEDYYASAKVGIRELPFRCAWAITAALNVYREIGEVLRRQGPNAWAGRVGAGKTRKIALALGAIGPAMARDHVELSSRHGFYQRPSA
jgi:phytoene synthase